MGRLFGTSRPNTLAWGHGYQSGSFLIWRHYRASKYSCQVRVDPPTRPHPPLPPHCIHLDGVHVGTLYAVESVCLLTLTRSWRVGERGEDRETSADINTHNAECINSSVFQTVTHNNDNHRSTLLCPQG